MNIHIIVTKQITGQTDRTDILKDRQIYSQVDVETFF
jgi:hypothetical protein